MVVLDVRNNPDQMSCLLDSLGSGSASLDKGPGVKKGSAVVVLMSDAALVTVGAADVMAAVVTVVLEVVVGVVVVVDVAKAETVCVVVAAVEETVEVSKELIS